MKMKRYYRVYVAQWGGELCPYNCGQEYYIWMSKIHVSYANNLLCKWATKWNYGQQAIRNFVAGKHMASNLLPSFLSLLIGSTKRALTAGGQLPTSRMPVSPCASLSFYQHQWGNNLNFIQYNFLPSTCLYTALPKLLLAVSFTGHSGAFWQIEEQQHNPGGK